MKRIPFVPLGVEKAKRLSGHLLGFGESLSKMFPSLHFHIQQSSIPFTVKEWMGLAFFVSLVYFGMAFGAVFVLMGVVGMVIPRAVGVGFGVGAGIGAAVFFYFAFYPRLVVGRRVRDLESNLPHALNHLLIHVRSGVTLFNSMESIAASGYGALSREFRKAVADINTGLSEIDALEKIALNNPSLSFRRIIWQMVNSMKSGADIGTTLKEIVENIAAEQKTAIKKYGSELNPLSLFYMMLVVIFPTMGIVFLLVLFSFVGAAFDVQLLLLGILGILAVMQVMFAGLIKNKRPAGL